MVIGGEENECQHGPMPPMAQFLNETIRLPLKCFILTAIVTNAQLLIIVITISLGNMYDARTIIMSPMLPHMQFFMFMRWDVITDIF
jgi:hypothetical protein